MTYRERLLPSTWLLIVCVLLVPAGILVFAPINLVSGIIGGVVLYGVVLGALLGSAPTVGVGPEGVRAGRALLPLEHVGEVEAIEGVAAIAARGTGLDARAFTFFRGGATGVVRVANEDASDPAPYWLISTRRPVEFAAAIAAARQGA